MTYSKATLNEDTKSNLRSGQRSFNSRLASAYSKRKTEIRFNTELGLRSKKDFEPSIILTPAPRDLRKANLLEKDPSGQGLH